MAALGALNMAPGRQATPTSDLKHQGWLQPVLELDEASHKSRWHSEQYCRRLLHASLWHHQNASLATTQLVPPSRGFPATNESPPGYNVALSQSGALVSPLDPSNSHFLGPECFHWPEWQQGIEPSGPQTTNSQEFSVCEDPAYGEDSRPIVGKNSDPSRKSWHVEAGRKKSIPRAR